MTKGIPIILLGVAFAVGVGFLLFIGSTVSDGTARASLREVIIFYPLFAILTMEWGALVIPTLIYFLAFHTPCVLIPAWPQHPRWRVVVDAFFACLSMPLLYSFLHSQSTHYQSRGELIVMSQFIFPCIAGFIFGTIYSMVRGLFSR